MVLVVHTCKPSTWEAEAGGWKVPGQPEPHSKMQTQNKMQCSFFFSHLFNSQAITLTEQPQR
jgi:hypothetical protein